MALHIFGALGGIRGTEAPDGYHDGRNVLAAAAIGTRGTYLFTKAYQKEKGPRLFQRQEYVPSGLWA